MISASHDHSLKVWTYEGDCLSQLVGHTALVYCCAATEDGLIASGSEDNTLRLWKADGTCLQVGQHHTPAAYSWHVTGSSPPCWPTGAGLGGQPAGFSAYLGARMPAPSSFLGSSLYWPMRSGGLGLVRLPCVP